VSTTLDRPRPREMTRAEREYFEGTAFTRGLLVCLGMSITITTLIGGALWLTLR